MAKLMGMLNLYREQLKAMARSLDQEGLSQSAIGKELGVDHRTIGRWLSGNDGAAKQGILPKELNNGHNVLSTATNSHYLVVCQSVEKFRPPDGITFPLIIAKELEIDQSTVSRWLTNNSRQGDLHNTVSVMHNALPKTRYLVVCETVEKFRPPDGITFPLIINGQVVQDKR